MLFPNRVTLNPALGRCRIVVDAQLLAQSAALIRRKVTGAIVWFATVESALYWLVTPQNTRRTVLLVVLDYAVESAREAHLRPADSGRSLSRK